jgi:hypothetical protein
MSATERDELEWRNIVEAIQEFHKPPLYPYLLELADFAEGDAGFKRRGESETDQAHLGRLVSTLAPLANANADLDPEAAWIMLASDAFAANAPIKCQAVTITIMKMPTSPQRHTPHQSGNPRCHRKSQFVASVLTRKSPRAGCPSA